MAINTCPIMPSNRERYESFLLRLWPDGEARQLIMLERITVPRQRFYFTSLEALFLFLETGQGGNPAPPEEDDLA